MIRQKIVNIIKSGERQKHGLDYEQYIIQKYNLIKSKNYTSIYDAYTYKNDIPVQIKCIKSGSAIEMGSYLRNKSKLQDFILVIGFWENVKNNIVKEHVMYIDHRTFTKNLTFIDDQKMLGEMKNISNSIRDDLKWTEFRKKYQEKWKINNNILDIRFKRDHKQQKRIQCAISYKNFNKKFLKMFKAYDFK
jgi:hypothetical protein